MFGFGAPDHPQYPIISFLCAIIILLPVSSHWKARNVATLSIIAWLFVINIIRFINTLVWANNVVVRWRIWCDITTKLTIGVTIALPAAALCICKYLEAVASIRQSRQTKEQKKRRMWFELFMCFGLPCIVMALHYTTQGHRYDLYEDFGCAPATVITWVAILVLYAPPLILSLIAFVYAGLAVRHFYYRRLDFQRLLAASNTGMTANRYLRLMALALTEMIFDTSINIWILVVNISLWRGLVPYTSWADIHFNFSRIQPYPEVLVPPVFWRNNIAAWYVIPIATVLFWSFFAFGQESMEEYRQWWNWIQRKVLWRDISPLGMGSTPRYGSAAQGSQNTSSQGGFRFKLSIPRSKKSSGTSSSDSPTTPTTPKGQRFALELKAKNNKDASFSLGDGDSFISADDDKPLPLSPISPMTPVSAKVSASYIEPELDTSIFDTISHVSGVPPSTRSINEQPHARSQTPEIQEIERRPFEGGGVSLGPYHPALHDVQDYSPGAPTFGNTLVPRSVTPSNMVSDGVKVEVDINVV